MNPARLSSTTSGHPVSEGSLAVVQETSQPASLQPSARSAGQRIAEFEGLRGMLSWWVVVDHLFLACGRSVDDLPRFVRVLAHGDYAVDLFIILSGYVIFKLLEEGRESYRVFMTRRFFRLMPVFLVCLAGSMWLQPLLHANLLGASWNTTPVLQRCLQNWQADNAHPMGNLFAHLTLLHGAIPERWLPGAAVAFLGAAWSISLEWQFYLVAPAVRTFLKRFAAAGALGFISGAILLQWCLGSRLETLYPMHSFLLQKLWLFWIGIASYLIAHKLRAIGQDRELGTLVLAWISPIVLLTTLSIPLALWTAVFAVSISPPTASFWGVRAVRRTLNSRPMQWLGKVSYSTYLAHALCIWCAQALVLKCFPKITAMECFAWMLPITSLLTLLVSGALHRYVERPGMAWGKHWANRLATARPATTAKIIPLNP